MKKILSVFCLMVGAVWGQDFSLWNVKNIHGKFVREQVTNLIDFRHKVTGLIIDQKTKATCTGILIGPKQVLTAAHCVYDFNKKEWSENLVFIPGKLSEADPGLGSFKNKKYFIQKEYTETMSEDFDFAVIELDRVTGIGFAGFRALKKDELTATEFPINFAGYAGDKDPGTMWEVACPTIVKEKLLSYYCDSYGGMSGSALFMTGDAENYVIGVHTFGGPEKNGGVYIDSKNYILIDAWKNNKPSPANTIVH